VPTSNPYGIPTGLNFSFPLRSKGDGNWELVRRRLNTLPCHCRCFCPCRLGHQVRSVYSHQCSRCHPILCDTPPPETASQQVLSLPASHMACR
jgi:hypothetical protein